MAERETSDQFLVGQFIELFGACREKRRPDWIAPRSGGVVRSHAEPATADLRRGNKDNAKAKHLDCRVGVHGS
jgi:hypothetical protein